MVCSIRPDTTGDRINFFYEESINKTHRVLTCYKNFHLVSGDLIHICHHNSTWMGEKPLCEVDYFKEKHKMIVVIVAVVTMCCLCLLVPDFVHFHMRKKESRQRMANLNIIKRQIKDCGRAQPGYVKPYKITPHLSRSYFKSTYEEDFMGTASGRILEEDEAYPERTRARRQDQAAQDRQIIKPTTFLTIVAHAFRKRDGDPNQV